MGSLPSGSTSIVLEEAVRRGRQPERSLVDVASDVWERSDLTGQQAMALARAETEAARTERFPY